MTREEKLADVAYRAAVIAYRASLVSARTSEGEGRVAAALVGRIFDELWAGEDEGDEQE